MPKDAGIVAVVALAISACATTNPEEPGYLSADQVHKLIVGKTIQAISQEGTNFRVYFDPDGQRLALESDGEYALPWRILPDGTQCVTTGTGDDCAHVLRNFDGTYSRMRDGQAVTRWLKISPSKDLGTLAPGTYVRLIAPNRYRVLLVAAAGTTEQQAHDSIGRTASGICKKQAPVMGLYRPESLQRSSPSSSAGITETRFTQELSCAP